MNYYYYYYYGSVDIIRVIIKWKKEKRKTNSGVMIYYFRYFGRARDLPGVRELFETEGKSIIFY